MELSDARARMEPGRSSAGATVVSSEPPIRALLAVEGGCFDTTSVARSLEPILARCARLTIAGVARPRDLVTVWAPLSGYPLTAIREEAKAEAALGVATAMAVLSNEVLIDHFVVTCWRELLAFLERGGVDLVLVAAPPQRVSDRWRLKHAIRRRRLSVVFPTA